MTTMLTLFRPRRVCAAAAGALLALGCWLVVRAVAEAQPPGGAPRGARYDGAVRCKDCHTQQTTLEQGASLSFVMLDEYAIWKTLDKHAQAYAVLRGERGQQMSKLLKSDVLKPETGCLNCHAMNALKTSPQETFNPEDGVSCGGCHGPSSGWLTEHTQPAWRKLSPREKAERGMKDVRDPETRSKLCMSCHIGNADEGKVVTHAMFAAGHPPLPPFEVATFSQNEPQHWRDAKDVPFFHILHDVGALTTTDKQGRLGDVRKILSKYRKTDVDRDEVNAFVELYPTSEEARKVLAQYPFAGAETQQTRLALMGNVVALRETLRLVVERADQETKADPKVVWPELLWKSGEGPSESPGDAELRKLAIDRWGEIAMSHSDCYACHHDLQYPGYRQKRGYGYRLPGGNVVPTTPGRVQIRLWPLAVLDPGVKWAGHAEGGEKATLERLTRDVKALAQACDERPFGSPERVSKAARQLMGWCDDLLKQMRGAGLDQKELRALLQDLCNMDALAYADYESARQIASVFQVGYDELKPRGANDQEVRAILKQLDRELNVRPFTQREERQKLIRKVVGAGQNASDIEQFWKAVADKGDLELLYKLNDNRFLSAIRTRITNARMNELLQTGVVTELEKVNDQELDAAMRKISSYNPDRFQERMKELGRALGGK
jgi:hypothetical protein